MSSSVKRRNEDKRGSRGNKRKNSKNENAVKSDDPGDWLGQRGALRCV
jgi:hypothetical protein